MVERRKDLKGRVLKDGEGYRKIDGQYTFRYRDAKGKVKAIYSKDLKVLRKREEEVLKEINAGRDYAAGKISVLGLTERYISLKQGVRYSTKVGYSYVLNLIKKDDFGYRSIGDIKPSEVQRWFIQLHNNGKGYSTLTTIRGVLRPAFQMAYEEDIIHRNPFDFVITKYVPNDSKRRNALTEKETAIWMNFIKNDRIYRKYYDEFVVLLGTGMRVSEFCGLTRNDIDFNKRRINVDHQLFKDRHGKYYIEKTKTECGTRFLPMTNDVYNALQKIMKSRRRMTEMVVDGYGGFILTDKNNCPKVALHIENEFRWAKKKYNKLYPNNPLPAITPHVFRHTFCTNMVNAGMDVKVLQYIMGHSEIDVTLNVYTHMGYEKASVQMLHLVDGTPIEKEAVLSM